MRAKRAVQILPDTYFEAPTREIAPVKRRMIRNEFAVMCFACMGSGKKLVNGRAALCGECNGEGYK